jgi:hypothetical protein
MEAQPGGMEDPLKKSCKGSSCSHGAHPGAIEVYPGAMEAHHGATKANSGAKEAHPGATTEL